MNYLAFDNSLLPSPFNIIEALMKSSCCELTKTEPMIADKADYFALLEKLSNKYITREEDVELRDVTVEDVTNARNEIISQYRHLHKKVETRNHDIEEEVPVISDAQLVAEEEDRDESDEDSELET